MSRLPLQQIIDEFDAINQQLSTITDSKEIVALSKKQKPLAQKSDLATKILKLENIVKDNQEILIENTDPEIKEMLEQETSDSKTEMEKLEKELLAFLAPADERDGMDIYLEIRAGAGGDESAIFAADLLRMYSGLCDSLGLKMKVVSLSENTVGGYKEVVAEIHGETPYFWFKHEGGVHRVQRVPATEKQGRIHTSTASVAVMPVVDQNSNFKLDLSEVDIIASTSQGAGGQSVNTTYSAIQVLHRPTGIRAQCQDERNQQQNKIKALEMLTSRVFNFFEEERLAKEYAERKEQVGKADRSEKIRTYNYPQDRITDHRYNISFNNLPNIMNGNPLDMINQIKEIEGENTLKAVNG